MSDNTALLPTLIGAAGPGLSVLTVTVVVLVGALTVLIVVATVVAIFGGSERGERASRVLGQLLEIFGRGGQQ